MQPLIFLLLCSAACSALPSNSVLLRESVEGPRYQYETDSSGDVHMVDTWISVEDLTNLPRYNPNTANAYHLFTRDNPTVSQPLVINSGLLSETNYNSTRRTAVLIHGWRDSVTSDFNNVLVPALLEAEDVNVIVVDWSSGAGSMNYRDVNFNSLTSAPAVARFITWLNEASGSTLDQYHIIGHGVGGHKAGMVGRNLDRQVPYITAVDPALRGWNNHLFRFRPNDGLYTEVIHTNSGFHGYAANLAHADFYPNGGASMPGCNNNACHHARGFHYLAESIKSGGFTGRECSSYLQAMLNMCSGSRTLKMGGLTPKTGSNGIYFVETNSAPPFSKE